MLFGETKLVDFIIGVLLFGTALLYLKIQDQSMKDLSDLANNIILEQKVLYQQTSDINLNEIPDGELRAIIMGYREYPIQIDDTVIAANDTVYEKYLPLVEDGFYKKSYKCNSNNEITQIIYQIASE